MQWSIKESLLLLCVLLSLGATNGFRGGGRSRGGSGTHWFIQGRAPIASMLRETKAKMEKLENFLPPHADSFGVYADESDEQAFSQPRQLIDNFLEHDHPQMYALVEAINTNAKANNLKWEVEKMAKIPAEVEKMIYNTRAKLYPDKYKERYYYYMDRLGRDRYARRNMERLEAFCQEHNIPLNDNYQSNAQRFPRMNAPADHYDTNQQGYPDMLGRRDYY